MEIWRVEVINYFLRMALKVFELAVVETLLWMILAILGVGVLLYLALVDRDMAHFVLMAIRDALLEGGQEVRIFTQRLFQGAWGNLENHGGLDGLVGGFADRLLARFTPPFSLY